MIYKLLHIYMSQCLLVRDLAQLLATRFLHRYPYSAAVLIKKIAGHQGKCTVVLGLVLRRDRQDKTKG